MISVATGVGSAADLGKIALEREGACVSDADHYILRLFKLAFDPTKPKVTTEEVEYFRHRPDELDEVSAPVTVHLLFLWLGSLLGLALVGLSKLLKFSDVLSPFSDGTAEFVIDVVFEIGVALIGAAVTAYVLGILLNQQQRSVGSWRNEVRRRIEESDEG